MRARLALAASLVIVLAAPPSFADAVPGPPDDCPAGSFGETSHSGQWCEPNTCNTDEDCAAPSHSPFRAPTKDTYVCRSQSLCIRHTKVPPGGRRRTMELIDRNHAVSTCDRGCSGDTKCERARRCVPSKLASASDTSASDASVVSIPTASADAGRVDVTIVDSPPAPARAKGCGCELVTRAPLGLGGIVAIGAVLGVLLRRRSGRS